MAIVFIVSHFTRFEHHRPNKFSAISLTTICRICYHIHVLRGYGGIGRRAGFRFQCPRRAGSSPVIRTTPEQAVICLLFFITPSLWPSFRISAKKDRCLRNESLHAGQRTTPVKSIWRYIIFVIFYKKEEDTPIDGAPLTILDYRSNRLSLAAGAVTSFYMLLPQG